MEDLISGILVQNWNEIEEQLKTLSFRCFKRELKERFLLIVIEVALNFYLPSLFFFFFT